MDWFESEKALLAPYAMHSCASRGRQHSEEPHSFRSIYQRDRERIVHCTAFRRMMGKTQVLVGKINDHHRTRLTHSLEVAQISRTVARRLRLNEDLTEAIALSHDIGHPPYGHAGEKTLDDCLKEAGGFDHNVYGLRRVDLLEMRYPEFLGLNLSWELREAFIQHSQRRDLPEYGEFFAAGSPLLEAQVVDAADSLAYDSHDTEDALGIGLITLDDLAGIELWRVTTELVNKRYSSLTRDELKRAVIRELISSQVIDLITTTERRINENAIDSLADVRKYSGSIIDFSSELHQLKSELELFLRSRVYQHYRVLRMARRGQEVLEELFARFVRHPDLLPPRHYKRWSGAATSQRRAEQSEALTKHSEPHIERVIVDYLAGMTDRFVRQEHIRLFRH